ncbi:MAG: hypothetical protein OWQ59_11575 [Alicyclobacillaceae bacterium]|jgi:Fe-S cluster assembly iron-binding protein IscA|uniref:hypothetical protein n=1 Tax=Alicyclobacillus sp. SP_1 TaxID=2942475 RepID=UPI0021573DA5|nr:hypothetical protein [Alicyclobacillus sp. SP_1]MCY0889080.1 hypothetical protein [Alicyclobacillaceae bacterium]
MALDESVNALDMQVEEQGVPFVFPEHLVPYLNGITIDLVDHGYGPGISIRRPGPVEKPSC